MMSHVSLALVLLLGTLSQLHLSEAQWDLQNIANTALNLIFDRPSNTGNSGYNQCVPYKVCLSASRGDVAVLYLHNHGFPLQLGSEFASYQDFCKYLSMKSDDEINQMFENGSGPDTLGYSLPLDGCVLGCIIGKDSYNRGMQWGAGSWSGKCIRNHHDIINLLTPIPSLGGAMTVLDTFNWSNFLPVREQYPGTIGVDWSWWDAYNTLASKGRMSRVWTLTYDDVQLPEDDPESTVDDILSAYPRLVKGSRDEVRVIEDGLVFGQLFRRPNSFLNPTPFPVDSGIRFAMIQVCGPYGYAWNGNSRQL